MSHNINKELKRLKQSVGYLRANTPTEVAVYQLKTTLTDAQIKTLPTTPVEILPPPGEDKAYAFIGAFINIDCTNLPYTNVNPECYLLLTYGNYDVEASAIMMMPTAFEHIIANLPAYSIGSSIANQSGAAQVYNSQLSAVINNSIKLYCDNQGDGDFGGGNADNNTLEVTVFYSIVDL